MLLLEKMGTPDIILSIVNKYEEKILECIKNYKSINININEIDLKSNLIINFKQNDEFGGNINFKECIDSNFQNCIINIFYPSFVDLSKIIKFLSHELTHLYELYQIKNIFYDSKWLRSKALLDTKYMNIFYTFHYFRDIFYLSLPHEINARLSSLYKYLLDSKLKDKNDLMKILKKTTEWQNFLNLKNFDNKKCYEDLIIDYNSDKKLLYELFNIFNINMKIKTTVNSDTDVFNYLKNSKKYFKKVASRYKKKMLKILNRSIEDNLNENFLIEIWSIKKYSNHIEKKSDINYQDYI